MHTVGLQHCNELLRSLFLGWFVALVIFSCENFLYKSILECCVQSVNAFLSIIEKNHFENWSWSQICTRALIDIPSKIDMIHIYNFWAREIEGVLLLFCVCKAFTFHQIFLNPKKIIWYWCNPMKCLKAMLEEIACMYLVERNTS